MEDESGRASWQTYVGVAVLVVVLTVAAVIATVNAALTRTDETIWNNEACVPAALKAYLGAQNTFRRSDFYGIGKKVYANAKDGAGFVDLYEIGGPGSGGEALKLIDEALARARPGRTPKYGYYFADIEYDDYEIDCGLSAVPAGYNRTGRNIFVVDVTGTVYRRDAAEVYPGIRDGDAVPPVTVRPDVESEGWATSGE